VEIGQGEEALQSKYDVQAGVEGASASGVVAAPNLVLLALADIECEGAEVGDVAGYIEVKPDVADLQLDRFGCAEAADGGEGGDEDVAKEAERGDGQEEDGTDVGFLDGELELARDAGE
jgi:hypothetical protein